MTGPNSPLLDCPSPTTTERRAAPQAVDPTAVGEPKGAARKGVVTALRSKKFTASDLYTSPDPTPDRPGIRVFAPPVYRDHGDGARWSTREGSPPSAAYACRCGQTGTARGARRVAALVAEYDAHTSACAGAPKTTPERRAVA
ncbi:hypothetical protein [Streptomyces sp. NPDC005435]|uniref:hypothetical protein n=1 Tax=Streptomyces sp. NPDC005435 TaxID=3154464 RepID=UPI0034564EC1